MSLFSTLKLATAWSTRSREIEAQRLQEHSDLLYDVLRSDFVARRQSLQDDLLHVIQNANSKTELHIPLWSYNYTYHVTKHSDISPEVYVEMLDTIRKNGYQWSVGLLEPGTSVEDDLWEKYPTSVESVFRKTDLLQRLAILFGDDYRISIFPVSVKFLTEPYEARVVKCELRLHYYPKGLPDYMWNKHDEVRQRYMDYAAPEWNGTPAVWTGCRDDPPALPPSRASTPPPPLVSDEPPPLARRSNGGGVQLLGEDFDGVSRRLSFNVSPCHCGYHHEEDED
jgi:hypothetical protein